MRLRMRTPAKVNLALHVGRRRPDSYHEVATVMQAVALFDQIDAETDPGGLHLHCAGPVAVPAGPANLAWRAATAAAAAAGRPPTLSLRLRKHIPTGAGLGGGSADAAAVLVAVRDLWGLAWADGELANLAVQLGSDVPFFLQGGRARATGRGELLEPLPATEQPVVLVKPPFGVLTADAYAWFDQDGTGGGENDLEAAVFRRHPELGAAKRELITAGADPAGMSGSGSALFGVMPSAVRAQEVACEFLRRGWWAVATKFWPRGVERLS